MRHGSLICVLASLLGGCPGGDGAIGARCSSHDDCSSQLQCVASMCAPRCERAPDCGDGYRCDDGGICQPATGQPGDVCGSEVDCVAGLACQLDADNRVDVDQHVISTCGIENNGSPSGATCQTNGDCRNNICELGHCIDLCSSDRDCGPGTSCTTIPKLVGTGPMVVGTYRGCLEARGSVRWSIPVSSANELVPLQVPASARSVSVLFSVDDPNQFVSATQLLVPGTDGDKDLLAAGTYYTNQYARHAPAPSDSVLTLPISPAPDAQLMTTVYNMRVQSQKLTSESACMDPPCLVQGTATPKVTAVIKVGDAAILDLHFYFLDLDDHPCASTFGGKLDATTAQSASHFGQYLAEIKNILGTAVYFEVGNVTYEDLRDHPDLDGLDVDNAPSLLALGAHDTGINVFFVRTLSPIGLQAFGPNPGPAGLAGTRMSGIVIGVDTLCYRSWTDLARLTAHEIARYMGLYENVGLDPGHVDPIGDSDMSATNLMFYSELGGTFLSEGQKQILRRSAVLR